MWIFLNNAFLSIVDPKAQYKGGKGPVSDTLLVRGRYSGDIERVFPGARVNETLSRDYRFRASIPRMDVARAIGTAVLGIDYLNFKGSTPEKWRHDTYMKCWTATEAEQRRQARHNGAGNKRLPLGWPDDGHDSDEDFQAGFGGRR